MEDQIIRFETAKLAKEKGFNIETINFYRIVADGENYPIGLLNNGASNLSHKQAYNKTSKLASASTQSQLQKWLRETHKIILSINYNHDVKKYCTSYEETYYYEFPYDWYETYEEALEQGLIEALNLIV